MESNTDDFFGPRKGPSADGEYGTDRGRAFDWDDTNHFFDIGGAVSFLLRHKLLILICSLLFAIIAAAAALTATNYYKSTAQLLLNVRQQNISGSEIVIGARPVNNMIVQNEIAVLLSDDLMLRVLETSKLVHPPFVEREAEGIRAVIGNSVRTLKETVFGASPPAAPPSLKQRIKQLRDTISVKQIGESFAIGIATETGDPDQSAAIANAVVASYQAEQIDEKFEVLRRAEKFLNERVARYEADLQKAEAALEQHRLSTATIDQGADEKLSENFEAINTDLATLMRRYDEDSKKLALVEASLAADDLAEVGRLLQIPRFVTLREQSDWFDTMITAAQTDSEADGLRAGRQSFQTEMEGLIERALSSARRNNRNLAAQVSVLEERLGALEERSQVRAVALLEQRRLERESDASRAVYESFLARLKLVEEQDGIVGADARVIANALPDSKPTSPKKVVWVLVGGILGGMIGLGLAVFRETFRNTFRKTGDIEKFTGVAEMAFFPRMKPRAILSTLRNGKAATRSPLSESAQNLQAALALKLGKLPQTILVTSTVPGEGKTTTSIALARAWQNAGKSALVIECDLHRPVIMRTFNFRADFDLLDVLNKVAEPAEAIHFNEKANLELISTRSVAQPVVPLSSPEFLNALVAYKAMYDIVILDGPPMIAVADSIVLSSIADNVLFCCRWNATPQDAVNEALVKLRQPSVNLVGAVMTMVNLKQEKRYHRFGNSRRNRSYSQYAPYTTIR